jgi:hypothetical protein
MESLDLGLRVGNDIIMPAATVVSDLGVLLDSELSIKKHISKVASVCYFLLRRLKPTRRILGRHITTTQSIAIERQLQRCINSIYNHGRTKTDSSSRNLKQCVCNSAIKTPSMRNLI